MRKLQIIRSKFYFKRFRLEITPEVLHFAVKGPLGIFFYPIPIYIYNLKCHPYRGRLVWFDYSTLFLNWLQRAQRSVSVGFYLELVLNGVAFKGDYLKYAHALHLDLGYSHYVCFLLPEDTNVKFEKRKLMLLSADYVWLTTAAYKLKKLRWPDPYRGKGVIYKNEMLKLRPGKQRQ